MRHHHCPYLPVVDEEDHLEGVISFMTLARRVVNLKKEMKAAFMDSDFMEKAC